MLYAASNGMIVSSAVPLSKQSLDALADGVLCDESVGIPCVMLSGAYYHITKPESELVYSLPRAWFPAEPREQDLAKPLYPLIETPSGPATLAVETVSALRAALTAAQQRVRTLESEVAMMARMNRSPISAPQAPVEEVTVAQ